MADKEKILFIINPISGIGKQKKVEGCLEKYLDKQKFDYDIAYTKYAHHATAISLNAVIKGYNIVVAVGGDGSINDCVRGLVGSKVKFAIIPAGSGNGLARHLHIPLYLDQAIKVINDNRCVTIDTIKLNDITYASIAGIGFDAYIAEEFSKSTTRGFQSYFKLVLQHYPFYVPHHYHLIIDDKEIDTEALFISFSNSNQFGYNAVVAPQASLNDGYMDISIVKKIPLVMAPFTAQLMFFREFNKSVFVSSYKAKQVKVIDFKDRNINLDGEAIQIEEDLNFSVNPNSLNVIIPKDVQ
ncbi:MAG: diacylglycerol kinase family lipid kinase [Bacteroidales bacterium]|jgi:YegS/Rv2252/BmrU family lipid kinase|nr:diacylglycerol kinase family lipid kinase [Bacteroidales bacterium]